MTLEGVGTEWWGEGRSGEEGWGGKEGSVGRGWDVGVGSGEEGVLESFIASAEGGEVFETLLHNPLCNGCVIK